MVRDFQSVIGTETISQLLQRGISRVDAVLACVGGGSNAMGTFYPFVLAGDQFGSTRLVGAEAAGKALRVRALPADMRQIAEVCQLLELLPLDAAA